MPPYGDSAQNQSILIPVQKSSDARVYDSESYLIQKDALRELQFKVTETLDRIHEFKKSLRSDYTNESRWTKVRYHDVIAVLGARGTGKTTFILNAIDQVCKEKTYEIRNLGIIDPTLIDVKENIFLNIISRIRAEVEARHSEINGQPFSEEKYELFLLSLNNLARGIAQINGIGSRDLSHDAWDNPVFILEEGLANVLQGEFLERDFHLFIDRALDFLDQKAFIMAFDDIDTNFTCGWNVLEIIRKYLTSPQLIVLLSGDFDLYSCLVRMNQWAYFGQGYIDKEVSKNGSLAVFTRRVDSLEDQYLLKIMKPSRRIELWNMGQIVQKHVVKVLFSAHGEDEASPLKDVLIDMLQNNYQLNSSTGLEVAVAHLINQPVRTIIQVLQSIEDSYVTPRADDEKDDPLKFHYRMARVFDTPLSHFGFHWSKDVLAVQSRFGMNTLALRLLDNGLLQEGAALPLGLGTTERDSMALVMSGLYGAAVWRKPALICDYFAKVLQKRDSIKTKDDDIEQQKRLKRELEIDELSLITVEKNARIIISSSQNDVVEQPGYFRISSESIIRDALAPRINVIWGCNFTSSEIKGQKLWDSVNPESVSVYVRQFVRTIKINEMNFSGHWGKSINTLYTLSSHIRSWHKCIVNILFVGDSTNLYGASSYLSAYQIVGLLALFGGEDRGAIKATFHEYLSPRTAGSVVSLGDEEREENGNNLDVLDDVLEHDSFEHFLALIENWQQKISSDPQRRLQFSVYEKIWHRFIETINRSSLRTPHLGYILESYVTAFLDAVLVEEGWHRYQQTGDSKYRIRASSNVDALTGFGNRLGDLSNKGVEIEKDFPMYNWFLSCPLWPLLLPATSNITTRTVQNIGNEIRDIQNNDNSIEYVKVDYSGVDFNGLYPLLNTLCFPIDSFTKYNIEKRSATGLQADVNDFLENIGDYNNEFYNISYNSLAQNWDRVKEILSEADIPNIYWLSRVARNNIYIEIMSDKDPHERSYVRPSSSDGKAYLAAFMKIYSDNI
jgi:hypothetical protein